MLTSRPFSSYSCCPCPCCSCPHRPHQLLVHVVHNHTKSHTHQALPNFYQASYPFRIPHASIKGSAIDLTKNATNYELLGVSRDATKQQILSAWKSAIAGIHPDKNKDSDSKRCAQGMCYVTRHLLHANLILILLCPSYQPSKRHITQPSNTSSTRQRYCRKPSAPCDNDF